MKIAVIGVKGLPAKQGGIEHYCEALYPRIVKQGHSVDLYARSSYVNKPWFSVYKHKGVRVICLPSLPIRGLDALTNSGFAAIVAALRSYDIVHFHALGPSLFSFIPRLLSSAKIIVTCQGLDWQRGKWGKASSNIIRLGEKTAAKYADSIVVVSKALSRYFEKIYGIDPVYIPNGPGVYAESDPSFSYVKSSGLEVGKYLLFLGRLVPEKRPELLIRAFQRLNKSGWKLVLAGGDSDTTEYISELHQLADCNPDIIFAGELKGSRLAEMVRGAGLFVLPSDLEGLPLAMLEAMREGVPVVASDIPPHQQLIGRDRGLLFKAGSIISCAMSLEQAMIEPKKRAMRASKAQDHIKANYDWEKITKDNLVVYSQDFNSITIERLESLAGVQSKGAEANAKI
jgi:glycosyltransferase involved in cell wall biosynthesis